MNRDGSVDTSDALFLYKNVNGLISIGGVIYEKSEEDREHSCSARNGRDLYGASPNSIERRRRYDGNGRAGQHGGAWLHANAYPSFR
ncbi:MAG: hypothetical protein IKI21_02515 [Oscillospiraceae bacterium]|nr:hypothetical protein [Oscillospiraceae bacterium]